MESHSCVSCLKPKANEICGICSGSVCKSCVQFVDPESFNFLEAIPEELTRRTYCQSCYVDRVEAQRLQYNRTLRLAKNINVFFKNQGKETRLIKRHRDATRQVISADRDEAIMRLAFLAVQGDFNAVVDVDISAEKLRNAGYQTSVWKASGTLAHVDPKKMDRQ